MKNHTYLVIDLKSFYAGVECADRHLDPMTTNLVVADATRTDKTICLAVSPSLKALGISGRARLFEVKEKVREVNAERLGEAVRQNRVEKNEEGQSAFSSASFDACALAADPSLELSFITAPPRMARYIEVSAQVYAIYLKFVAPDDIFQYSIDEAFIDVTPYLETYHMTPHDLAMTMMREILYTTGVISACGIGTNLYLAKVAADIVAKHAKADADGVRIGELDERSYRLLLWDHRPLTDFWRIGPGTAGRLESHGITTMGEAARRSLSDEEWFYRTFGIDAEILIDHVWGIEPVTIKDVKAYTPKEHSLCEGQVLASPYPYEKARIVLQEMTDSLMYQLTEKQMVTDRISIEIGYDRIDISGGNYQGKIHLDHYGRTVPKPARGTVRLEEPTNLGSRLREASEKLFDRIVDRNLFVKRITVTADHIEKESGLRQMSLFTDQEEEEKEKNLQEALAGIRKRYGKNAILKGLNFEDGATMRERNRQIGGHKAE